ncbi:MAG: SPOR domain-containing protein [Rhodoferax sp.]|uniref:SPOR domain-containing protein n=1 Tax=Rhodoferax sp. TaxID=50421 RepID=UPI00260E7D6A|nr:SPOR domain-containing protein [Rhodoferax sp.]MDD2881162.1 SPOR domain-containing protein [Rhodoferax sp.]
MMNGRTLTRQRGGTFLGFIVGLVVGLGVALVVAVYITKVPVPFVNKMGNHTPEKDASELQKNKDWDPNTPLYGKNPAKPVLPAETTVPSESAPVAGPASSPVTPSAKADAKPEFKPAVTGDPLGDLAKSRLATKDGAAAAAEPFTYFVQAGAFRTREDAESQRAKLSLAGIEAKVSEREQAGRTVYRVRTGPFDKREEADKSKARLDALSIETALVRVQR